MNPEAIHPEIIRAALDSVRPPAEDLDDADVVEVDVGGSRGVDDGQDGVDGERGERCRGKSQQLACLPGRGLPFFGERFFHAWLVGHGGTLDHGLRNLEKAALDGEPSEIHARQIPQARRAVDEPAGILIATLETSRVDPADAAVPAFDVGRRKKLLAQLGGNFRGESGSGQGSFELTAEAHQPFHRGFDPLAG